jgi:PST family polysaccharide transporter
LVLVFNIDYLIVGRRLGTAPLGIYTLAFRIPQTVIIYVFYVLSTVAYPLFSKAQAKRDQLRRGYLASIRLQSTYGVATGVGIAMVAPMLVRVLLPPKWLPAIVPLEAIALYAAFRALSTGAGDVYKGIGRPRLSLWLALLRLAILAPALWWAAGRGGINWVAWAQVVVAFVMAAVMQGVATRILGLPLRALARAFRPAAVIGAGVAIGGGSIRFFVHLPTDDWRKLALAVGCGAAGGLLGLIGVERPFLREVLSLASARTWLPGPPPTAESA